jgi:hypothetical protein
VTDGSILWIVVLRPYEGDLVVDAVMSLAEMSRKVDWLELRIRLNADIRMVTLRLPGGTRRDQVSTAIASLDRVEQRKLYLLGPAKTL